MPLSKYREYTIAVCVPIRLITRKCQCVAQLRVRITIYRRCKPTVNIGSSNAEISGRTLTTAPEVIAELRSLAATRPVFIKDTTDRRHPEVLADRRFLAEDAQHTFLIRHPRETFAPTWLSGGIPGYTSLDSRPSMRCTQR